MTVHVTDFASPLGREAWRRAARRALPECAGLAFAKAMLPIGNRRSAGFGPGVPDLYRQLLLASWDDARAMDSFTASPLGRGLRENVRWSWRAVLEPLSTRGSFHGARPIASHGQSNSEGPLAVITLGRASRRTLARFLLDGAKLSNPVREAPGMITAATAGHPLSGNATFSLWDSELHMLDFAYGDGRGGAHLSTVRVRPPILAEQLNARLRPLSIEGCWDRRATLAPDRLGELADALRVTEA